MKKILPCLLSFAALASYAQNDFTLGTQYPEGVTAISKYVRTTSKSETRYGLLDNKSKKVILPPQYRSVYPAGETNYFIVKDTTDKVGIYSIKSGFVVTPQFREVDRFQEGVAIVRGPGTQSFSTSFGAIDKTGQFVIPMSYDYVAAPSEGLLNFRKDGKFGFLNLKNEIVIPAKYGSTGAFVNGMAPADDPVTKKHGFINKSDEWVIQPAWTDADNFHEGYAKVYTSKRESGRNNVVFRSDTIGLIDTRGKIIIPPAFTNISWKQKGGLFIVELGNRSGLIDSTGKTILPLEEQKIGNFTGVFALFTKEGMN
jgi:hypothetical protein